MNPSPTVIIVDDDDDDRRLIREAFHLFNSGITFLEAFDGKEAIALLDSLDNEPSLILVDLNMPVMNGLEMITEIRSRQSSTPMALISTSLGPEMVQQALEIGANCCYIKPVKYEELCSLAHQLLRRFLPGN
ncbi:hypothetical protein GCM10010967_56180 [Dyadobacter beijingensis]|uniref:Response regulatory domain-containing protein n=1 Tax=Dyadobacter beijingensis TaxID=365489 RepID=A0ABQ2IJY6_9BACT|nr:response regulator [Dyadobacter beijingensis]GGN12916.1 hypothetical protein GCM10010967_56180 [Dyadobacter beijingensis]